MEATPDEMPKVRVSELSCRQVARPGTFRGNGPPPRAYLHMVALQGFSENKATAAQVTAGETVTQRSSRPPHETKKCKPAQNHSHPASATSLNPKTSRTGLVDTYKQHCRAKTACDNAVASQVTKTNISTEDSAPHAIVRSPFARGRKRFE